MFGLKMAQNNGKSHDIINFTLNKLKKKIECILFINNQKTIKIQNVQYGHPRGFLLGVRKNKEGP